MKQSILRQGSRYAMMINIRVCEENFCMGRSYNISPAPVNRIVL